MNGRVDAGRRALISIRLKLEATSSAKEVEAWVDTGFNGDLVVPRSLIEELRLSQSGTVDSQLGDGATVVLDTYSCLIDWFGEQRQIEVAASFVNVPLFGAGLLQGHRLVVDYSTNFVSID